jgi:hypothetical protein
MLLGCDAWFETRRFAPLLTMRIGELVIVKPDLLDFLAGHMADPMSQWSVGTFGALAEFMRDVEEPVDLRRGETSIAAITPRGAIWLEVHSDMQAVALEVTSATGWNQRVALCLPEAACDMSRRAVLTEIGPDEAAVRVQDRSAILFDLGLDTVQIDAHVRVADPQVAARLRAHAGRSVFETGNPAMGIILQASPPRVFVSRLGRVEVYQPIPPPGGKSPQGPHTHVLPKLLQSRRTHPATEAIPAGLIPAAYLYPAHPLKDGDGLARPFDRAHHAAFQETLRSFGDPKWLRLKARVAAAVAAGEAPFALAGGDRHARACVRISLRQIAAAGAPARALAAWLAAYENERGAEGHP